MADIGDPYTGIAELYKNINEHKNFNIDCNILCRRQFCCSFINPYGSMLLDDERRRRSSNSAVPRRTKRETVRRGGIHRLHTATARRFVVAASSKKKDATPERAIWGHQIKFPLQSILQLISKFLC